MRTGDPNPRSHPERVGRWLIVGSAVVGALGLLDSLLGTRLWSTYLPNEPPMRPITALGLLLVGTAGALRQRPVTGWARRTLSSIAALFALTIGVLTLGEYAFGVDLRIDHFLSHGQPGPYPGRSSPLAAAALTLLACGILLMDVRPAARARPSEWFTIGAWLVGFTAILGFVFGAAVLYRMARAPLIGVAPPTAVGILLASTGLLLVRPSAGFMRVATAPGSGGVLLRRLVPATILGPTLLGVAALHLLRALRVESLTLLAAIVAASTTAMGLLLLGVTAGLLNRAHGLIEAGRARIRDLVEHAPDGIFVADLDGRYTDVNRAGCRMLGYTHEELVQKTILELIPSDRIPQLEQEKARLLHAAEVVSEWLLRKKDGTWLPVEVSAKILPDGRWQGFVRDISVRKRLEAALQEAHADLIRAQSVAEVGSWRLELQNDELRWSAEEYKIFGVEPGTPMNYESFLACVHPDDRAYVSREWSAALRGQPYDIEHRIVANGTVRWVREKADLEFDEHHTLIGGIGVTLHITDRKRREEELRQTYERLELALRGADLASWDWNIPSGEVAFNARWAELRGHRSDELRGHVETWTAGVHPEDLPRLKRALDEYLQGKRPEYECEYRVRTKSGQWVWILDRGKVFARDERGAPVRMVGTELDITARRRSEEAIRLAEAKSTGIVSLAADAIVSTDKDQRITLFNEGAESIFGYSKAEVIGAPLDLLFPERLRSLHRKHVESFVENAVVSRRMGQRGRVAILGLRKNGQEFPAEAAISKLEIGGERILTVVLRDVTEQRRSEREQRFLATTGELFASSLDPAETLRRVALAAVEFMADFVLVDLVEGTGVRRAKVAHADPAHAEVAQAIDRLSPLQHQPPLLQLAIETRRTQVLTPTDELLHAEHPLARAPGIVEAMKAVSVMFVPLIARDEVIGVMTFVSSRPGKVYEESDVRLAEEVARRAALALDNSRLYRLANDAIEARDEVLGIVAHDLRNPLNVIVLQAALARQRGGKPADVIERAAKRMNRLIQDLLDVTRLDSGRLSIEGQRLHTAQLVTDALEAHRPLASSTGLELRLDLAPELPDLWADRDRLLQVFENLIGNALKFSEPGGHITVGAAPRDGEALFWVADTGFGIAEEDVPHLFDRFWQGRKARKHGAGLGLAIVKGIVQAHGGRIWVESKVGSGSTFFFTVPTAPPAEAWRAGPEAHGP